MGDKGRTEEKVKTLPADMRAQLRNSRGFPS
jgi:hypothetical protein